VKVAIIAPLVSAIREPQRGGSQAFVSELARGLVARGHQIDLYAASGSRVADVQVIDTGVDHRTLSATLYRASGAAAGGSDVADAAFAGVYAAVRETQYDVVHNHAFDAPAITRATSVRAPVIHTLHLPPDTQVAGALRQAAARNGSLTVACVSARQASSWRRIVRVDAVLPPYVPTTLIDFSPAPGHGAVFAGRLSPEKGAVEAIEIARAAGIRLDLYGDPYDDAYARALIDPRRSERGVIVHASIPQRTLWKVMARAAVVLCPARWEEPFGMVAAEAQACGTPVVAFRRGALEEVILDGVTGFLVAPDDVRAAAEAVRRVSALSRSACRVHAERDLDLERSLDAHEQLYREVVGSSAVTGSREEAVRG